MNINNVCVHNAYGGENMGVYVCVRASARSMHKIIHINKTHTKTLALSRRDNEKPKNRR